MPPLKHVLSINLLVLAALLGVACNVFEQAVFQESLNLSPLQVPHRGQEESVLMPDLTEKTTSEARRILARLGLQLGVVDDGDSLLPKGEIFEQTPAAQSRVSRGTSVKVVKSAGIGLTGPQERAVKTVELPKGLQKQQSIPAGILIRNYVPSKPTRSLWCMPHLVQARGSGYLSAVDGSRVELVADDLRHPRNLAEAPNGDIFAVESRIEIGQEIQPMRVVVIRPGLKHPLVSVWADKLNLPFGISFHGGYVYVANTGTVVRWRYSSGDTRPKSRPEVVFDKIPERGMRQHWTRNILFDDRLNRFFVTVGSKANVAIEEPERATIGVLRVTKDGRLVGPLKTFGGGMRNPVGLGLNPVNGELLTCVNERDYLGDELVPDYVTSVHPGAFFGWPYYWIGKHRDLRVAEPKVPIKKVDLPDAVFAAHSAPIGLVAKGRYVYVALHGSQNRAHPVGYSVVRIPLDPKTGEFSGPPETFIRGWFIGFKGRKSYVYGRPAGLSLDRAGNLLIADDWGGRIWRVYLKDGARFTLNEASNATHR